MRVVIIPHGFQEHYALGFANGLATRGMNVEFALARNMNSALLHPKVRWRDLGRNTEADISLPTRAYRYLAYHLRLIGYVAARRGHLVHVIGMLRAPLLTGIIEGLLFRALSRRYVLTVHNLLPHDRHTAWNRWLFKRVYRIPHLLVVHTARMKEELAANFGINKSSIVVMQHGLNDIVPDHGRPRAECRAQLGLPHNSCVLLMFGRMAPYKGANILLEAFGKVDRNCFLVIAGAPISAAYGRRLRAMVNEHPCRENILYHGRFIENSDIASYFRAADALVMPYKHIDQSGVLFLAFRFGLPVIAFDVGALHEYLQDDGGVLVREHSAQALAGGIQQFQREQDRFAPDRIQRYALRFRWEHVLEPLMEAYRAT